VTPKDRASKKKEKGRDEAPSSVDVTAPATLEGRPGRAMAFRDRYMSARASTESLAASADYEAVLIELLDLAVPLFADWVAIDVVDENGDLRRLAVRHLGCKGSPNDQDHGQCSPALVKLAHDLDEVARRAISSGRSEVSPGVGSAGLPWGVIVGLRIRDQPFAVVSFIVDEQNAGYGTVELAIAEEVVGGFGNAIERAALHQDARAAVRGTQKIASQLHQLIAVSITVAGLRDESEILTSLAGSTRRVFDADVATVSIDAGPAAPLRGVARRGGPATCVGPDDDLANGLPTSGLDSNVPWRENDWLVAPILERRGHSKGVVAVRRSRSEFLAEDDEVLTLLAQMAATSLAAAELSRSIRHSEARWRILVETAPAGIVEVDLEGNPRWWNQTASRIFAWPGFDQDTADHPPPFPESAQPELASIWAEVLGGAPTSGRDYLEVEIKGRRRELTASAALLPTIDSEERSILMLVDDVTDHRQLKAEVRHAQQMETRGQVASSIAHDFNNLLTLISGYAEILTRDLSEDERSLEMVKDIQATASRASLLTAQLQTIGRTKSLQPVVLDPVAVLQSNAEVIERIVGRDIGLTWALNMKAGHVRADAGQFEQMILNLVINARDAMASGGDLTIGVDTRTVSANERDVLEVPEGEYVVILVADTGVGMAEETRRRCFEPFFTTKDPFKGTGMGLAAARRLVEESGGSIACRSEVGVGTTFEILLPAFEGAEIEERPPAKVTRPRGSATVLLAEDDGELRRLITQVLGRNGYRILEAETGEQALQLAHEFDGEFDLLISDVIMGNVTGPELARTLQSANPALRVLMMSGTADATVLDELLPGNNAFLAKPFRPSELIDQVHEILSRD
jgi:PAS domain S-box-containing protein